jgi:YesN/AraC family two-component response regulator
MQVVSSTDNKLQSKRGYSTRFTISIPIEKSAYHKNEIFQPMEVNDSTEDLIYFDDYAESDNINGPLKELELPNRRTEPLISVVEDNDDLRRFIVNSLNNYYSVIEATNGSEGFNSIISHMPDLIISDILMPEMSGIELCDKLKKDIRTSHIPVILLTARTADENKMEGFQSGADDYITKPFNMSLLIARINNILTIHLSLRRKYKNEELIQPDEVNVSSIDKQFMEKVKTIVEENYTNHLFGVKELSDEIGISRRHLLFKLKNLVDMTATNYIKVFRLKKAAQLLANKKASISEIVYETGFNDISYFGKCFTKYFGKNPSTYIKTYYKTEDNL